MQWPTTRLASLPATSATTYPTTIVIFLCFGHLFLIVHLGGPDTVTALALKDNELWLRHFLTLVFQVVATLYVFLLSLPKNKLMISTILMFLSGCIKYLERTRSLYLVSGDRFPWAFSAFSNSHFNYEKADNISLRHVDDLRLVRIAYRHKVYQIPSLTKYVERCVLQYQRATTALRVLEVELNFLYDILFTKTLVVHTSMGFIFRFFSFCCIITSLAVFHFHITKHGVFNGINVAVTYVLFLGAVALELIAFLMAVLSDWTVVAMMESNMYSNWNWWRRIVAQVSNFVQPAFVKIWSYWTPCWYLEEAKKGAPDVEEGAQLEDQELRTPLLFRRWSCCLSGHNLIRYSRPSGIPIVKSMDWLINWVGLRDLVDEMSCLSREPLRKNLWNLIFQQLNDAHRLLQRNRVAFLKEKTDLVQLHKILKDHSYDESLVLWHVATELLYNDFFSEKNDQDLAISFSENNNQDLVISFSENNEQDPRAYAKMSKTLSDYMMYLLIMQPDIMVPVAGRGKAWFQGTCAAAKKFFDGKDLGPSPQVGACKCILKANTRAELQPALFSFLNSARLLANELQKLEDKKKWEFISEFWVESLCYAASHCSLKVHAQQLRKGGELITFVWLLMQHFMIRYDLERQRLTKWELLPLF